MSNTDKQDYYFYCLIVQKNGREQHQYGTVGVIEGTHPQKVYAEVLKDFRQDHNTDNLALIAFNRI